MLASAYLQLCVRLGSVVRSLDAVRVTSMLLRGEGKPAAPFLLQRVDLDGMRGSGWYNIRQLVVPHHTLIGPMLGVQRRGMCAVWNVLRLLVMCMWCPCWVEQQ
jgi:hypothetical protein